MIRRPPRSTLFPTRRSSDLRLLVDAVAADGYKDADAAVGHPTQRPVAHGRDRKSTRLNSSHTVISYAVFCLKKKKKQKIHARYEPYTNNQSALAPENGDKLR